MKVLIEFSELNTMLKEHEKMSNWLRPVSEQQINKVKDVLYAIQGQSFIQIKTKNAAAQI